MLTRYTPHSRNTREDTKAIGDELTRWKKNLPQEMLLQDIDEEGGAGFWACMLHASYQSVSHLAAKWSPLLTNCKNVPNPPIQAQSSYNRNR